MTVEISKSDFLIWNVGQHEEKFKSIEVQKPLIKVSNDDYESLPSYLKGLAPWEV